ncbi:MAG TPA: universal stress protein [Nocardioidaceae bacterium]|nr:universal stress protein [Nocardioidaceae bacterium]
MDSVARGSVVVGVDGSRQAIAAVRWAARFASDERRTLTLVHACGGLADWAGLEDVMSSERSARGRAVLVEAWDAVRERFGDLHAVSVVDPGQPGGVLVEASQTAAVVVVGGRGSGSLARMLLGSVADQVARSAWCPVVVVHELEERTEVAPGGGLADERPVVVGVDGSPASVAAIDFAFRVASVRGRQVELLHATWDLRERASGVLDTRSYEAKVEVEERAERMVAETVAGFGEKYPDVTVLEDYRNGDAAEELVRASARASLVVVGAHGHNRLHALVLGSVSSAVAARAECPVAVVRPV